MPPKPKVNALPDLGCACANVRRAARLVTQLYSREMGDSIEPTQFAILYALSSGKDSGQGPLGRLLGLDKTTLSRNLRVIERNGWIERTSSEDLRERGYRLTAAGRKTLTNAHPGWLRAQGKLRAALRPGEWESAMKVLGRVSAAALALNESD